MSRQQRRYEERKAAKINRFKPMAFSDDMKHLAYTHGWKPLIDILKHAVSSEDFLTDPRVPDEDKKVFGKTNTFDIWVPHEYVEDCPQNVTQYGQISQRDETHMNSLQEVIGREGLNNPGTMWMDIAMLIAGHHRRWVCKTRLGTKGFVYSVSRKFSYLQLLMDGAYGQAKIEELLVDDNMRPDRHPWDLFQSIESIYSKYIEAGTMTADQWTKDGRSAEGKVMNALIRKHPMEPTTYRAFKRVIEGFHWTNTAKKDKGALIAGKTYFVPPRPNLWDSMKKPVDDSLFRTAVACAKNQLDDFKLKQQAVAYVNSKFGKDLLGVDVKQPAPWLDLSVRKVISILNKVTTIEEPDGFGGYYKVKKSIFTNNGMADQFHRQLEMVIPTTLYHMHGLEVEPTIGNEHIDYISTDPKTGKKVYVEFKCSIKGKSLTSNLPKYTHVLFCFMDGTNYDKLVMGWIDAKDGVWSQTQGRPQLTKASIKEHGNIVIGDIVETKNSKGSKVLKMVYKKVNPEVPLINLSDSSKFF